MTLRKAATSSSRSFSILACQLRPDRNDTLRQWGQTDSSYHLLPSSRLTLNRRRGLRR